MYKCMSKKDTELQQKRKVFPGALPGDGRSRTRNAMVVNLYK